MGMRGLATGLTLPLLLVAASGASACPQCRPEVWSVVREDAASPGVLIGLAATPVSFVVLILALFGLSRIRSRTGKDKDFQERRVYDPHRS